MIWFLLHCFFDESLFFHAIDTKAVVGDFIGLLITAFTNAVVKILTEINSFFYHSCCFRVALRREILQNLIKNLTTLERQKL